MHSLTSMLKYRRRQHSDTQKDFCVRFLHPIFGKPDKAGNYVKIIGKNPSVCFTSHHDTVHRQEGLQKIQVINDVISLAPNSGSSCLGADCTTGIWLQLEMIEAGIEGVYVVHAAEEIGCIGSKALVDRNPRWLRHVKAVISFDRKGDSEIITHQSGYRTASDAFAQSLAQILQLDLEASPNGSYTDSNVYRHKVSECTNLAVGYYGQHTKNETQDLKYLMKLRDALLSADWSKLVFERDPNKVEFAIEEVWDYGYSYPFRATSSSAYGARDAGYYDVGLWEDNMDDDLELIQEIALDGWEMLMPMLQDYFGTPEVLIEELQRYGYKPDINRILNRR